MLRSIVVMDSYFLSFILLKEKKKAPWNHGEAKWYSVWKFSLIIIS